MAHFAEINSAKKVLRILVVGNDQEHRGAEYLANDLKLGGTWIQCSYNGTIRKQYPGAGYTYDSVADVFVAPQPFPSWALDANHDWQPPTLMPTDGRHYVWDEGTAVWTPL